MTAMREKHAGQILGGRGEIIKKSNSTYTHSHTYREFLYNKYY